MYIKAYCSIYPALNKTFTKAHPERTIKLFRNKWSKQHPFNLIVS